MRVSLVAGCLALISPLPALSQSACSPSALHQAAEQVARLRAGLAKQAVGVSDPVVPPSVGSQLGQLKDALALAATSAFACASAADTPEQMQQQLADALHANLPMTESSMEINGKQDIGTYGTDLAVQVNELRAKPHLFSVDFRYGIECGDDHLLLVFGTGDNPGTTTWRKQMRWDTADYKTVGDALGDFVLLAPLTGNYKSPTWRYLVAHGRPSCADSPHPSTFDLDLLTPTEGGGKPSVSWHFEHGYTHGNSTARLSTTEDTIRFQLLDERLPDGGASGSSVDYRFHLSAEGHVEPSSAAAAGGSPTSPSVSAKTPKPR